MSRPFFERTISRAGVQQQEVAGAVGVLRLARAQTHLSDHRCLLVTEVAGQRDHAAERPVATVCPYRSGSEEGRISGSMLRGMSKKASSSSSQSSVSRFISMVRLALVGSVT